VRGEDRPTRFLETPLIWRASVPRAGGIGAFDIHGSMRFVRHLGNLLGEFIGFARQNKAWWIVPIVLVLRHRNGETSHAAPSNPSAVAMIVILSDFSAACTIASSRP
jgi:hypothetical protein